MTSEYASKSINSKNGKPTIVVPLTREEIDDYKQFAKEQGFLTTQQLIRYLLKQAKNQYLKGGL